MGKLSARELGRRNVQMGSLLNKAVEKGKKEKRVCNKSNARFMTLPAVTSPKTRVELTDSSKLKKRLIFGGLANDPISDIFRVLRLKVLKHLRASGASTIAICSANPGEGKTLVAANLAASLAMDINHTVLLADVDLRRPSLQSLFGLSCGLGLSDYLLRNATIPECLVSPGIDRLVLLPAGAAINNSSELLSSPMMLRLTKELKSRYSNRIVVYDLPPLLPSDDGAVLLEQIDASILVVEDNKTPKHDIEQVLDALKEHELIATVLNKSRYPQKRYHYESNASFLRRF